ncbi:hypothetical protein [Streptomyces sp. CRN 30]|uniref:hypothetical protein n=1 Tax=Streptomyces sp. CRN 30 TaxID=3075613 RepID=UPI002A8273F2|nr:hypothetical protein [Streptomyces sp. CRN 30]
MVDLSPTQLVIIAVIVLGILALIVFGLRRGSLKRADFQGLGVRAGVEGHQEAKPLADQTMQTDGLKSRRSRFRIVKSARTSFRRSSFSRSTVEILPDDGSVPPDRTPPSDPSPGSTGR